MEEKNKLAVFDLDGTLFDTKNVNYKAYSEAIKLCGYDTVVDYEYFCAFCNGNQYKTFIPEIIPEIAYAEMEKIHKVKQQIYPDYLVYARKNEHLFSFIRIIRKEYITAVVTTASKVNTVEILKFFSVYDYFDFIVTQEDVKKKKPSPECFLKAMKKAGVDKSGTIIFEDSSIGLLAAEESGAEYIKVYGYN